MRNTFVFTAILTILFTAPLIGAAAPRCESLFVIEASTAKKTWSPTPVYETYTGGLDVKLLERAGYVLEGDIVFEKKKYVQVGVIKKLQPQYLFEWADKAFHKDIIKNGGIFDEWMKAFLKERPQSSGRGFYVSTHPIDSLTYGPSLTVFKVTSPIYVLEAPLGNGRDIFNASVQKTEALARAGIDALRFDKYTATWLNFISNRHLRDVSAELPADAIRNILFTTNEIKQDFLSLWGDFSYKPENLQNLILSKDAKVNAILVKNLLSLVDNKAINSSLKPLFRSDSENAKLLGLVFIIKAFVGSKQGAIKFPKEALEFLRTGSAVEGSFESRYLKYVWEKLSPADQALVSGESAL